MTNDQLYKPGLLTSGRVPQLGEFLFEFVREFDRAQIRCDLRYHGDYWGVEAKFFKNRGLLIGRRFDTKAQAVQWAELELEHIEKGGA